MTERHIGPTSFLRKNKPLILAHDYDEGGGNILAYEPVDRLFGSTQSLGKKIFNPFVHLRIMMSFCKFRFVIDFMICFLCSNQWRMVLGEEVKCSFHVKKFRH